MITLITPGGGRPQAFALCERFMSKQTIWGKEDIQWIVADDNEKDPVVCTLGQEHIFGGLRWKSGINTLRYNLAAALPLIKGDEIFIIENDDLYKPQYLEVMSSFLKQADLVGFTNVTYYSLATKGFMEMHNQQHASLCCSAFKKTYLPHFERALHSGEQFFDIKLWGNARRARHKYLLFSGMDNISVGIKGTPGRSGIGVGHEQTAPFIADPHFVKLAELVGNEYVQDYKNMLKG